MSSSNPSGGAAHVPSTNFKRNLSLAATSTSNANVSSTFNVDGKETIIIDQDDINQSTRHSVQIVSPIPQGTPPKPAHRDMLNVSPAAVTPMAWNMVAAMRTSSSVATAAATTTTTTTNISAAAEQTTASSKPHQTHQQKHNTSQMDVEFPALSNASTSPSNDLVTTLGGRWPATAGPMAAVLNTPRVEENGSASMVGGLANNRRNRSANPLSHITKGSLFEDAFGGSNEDTLSRKKLDGSDHHIYDNVPQSVSALGGNSSAVVAADVIHEPEPAPVLYQRIPNTSLEIGSMIEVSTDILDILYGLIRWIGVPAGHTAPLVGVELENDLHDSPLEVTNGSWRGRRLFRCPSARGLFVAADQCSADRRFGDAHEHGMDDPTAVFGGDVRKQFGDVDCPIVEGVHAPMNYMTYEKLAEICGPFKGIQGHHNSCYLDATLFSMFAFSRVFDAVLYREANEADIAEYTHIQTVLRNEIVNPLRTNNFVRADRVLRLRKMLEDVCSVKGLTSEEKDPEEFLNILLAEAMKAAPFLQLNSGQEAFCYQLFVDKDERLQFPSVQQLFDQSFLACDIKLQAVPNCLIVQMPRFGKDYKMYARILPSLVLDVTDVIANSPRQCNICGTVAHLECKECFAQNPGMMLEQITYCRNCWPALKQHKAGTKHKPRELTVPDEFYARECNVSRVFMELFAVVCIETSHYVSFVKTGPGENAPWCFFDSMADRQGAQAGCNIPQLVPVEDLPLWISESGARKLNENAPSDKHLPKLAKRLLCDAYLCMYQSKDILMYQ